MAEPNRSDSEWAALIAETEKNLSISGTDYPVPDINAVDFTKTIDHTLLKLDATASQFDTLCAEARTHQFATVCVRPEHVARCVELLAGTDVRVASVVGFHEGTYDTAHKISEITQSLASGATELDIVLNYPMLLAGHFAKAYTELASLRQHADTSSSSSSSSSSPSPPRRPILKLILETSRLSSRDTIVAACVLAAAAGYDFVKTSTGFNGPGARIDDVRVMRACGEELRGPKGRWGPKGPLFVKASGGIRTLADARKMLAAGAARLGTSAGVAIAGEAKGEGKEGGDGERGAKGEY